MDKKYKHKEIEDKIYQEWKAKGYFTPKVPSQTRARYRIGVSGSGSSLKPQAFSIIMPPPNANAQLHVGHALFLTVEDILTRYRRMQGYEALWLPGADHAGILTQVVFERHLEKQGKTRYNLGREEFYRQCYQFTQDNKKIMYNQMEKIGASCDWTRERFTLDPDISQTVLETFVNLYRDGLVYRAERMINWCPRCMTALSNLEVEREEKKEPLYYLRYGPIKEQSAKSKEQRYLAVATVRPETMFGDTAVAVHPEDKRYKNLISKKILLPLVDEYIPIIADLAVDPEFGTGAVKITPAHDWDDFATRQRHKLAIKQVIEFDGKLNSYAGKYAGLTIKQARKAVVADLEKKGLIEKIDTDYVHSIAKCERCKTTIEPMVSLQWFINVKAKSNPPAGEAGEQKAKMASAFGKKEMSLQELGILAVKKGLIKIIPRRFERIYFRWMENLEDWCMSRQLWWGHRMPVWYCGTKGLSELQKSMNPDLTVGKKKGCGEIIIQLEKPPQCVQCDNTDIIQEPDTFDTWFSSGQWPYTTLGFRWNGKHDKDYKYFYPTSVMETGYEILFFWVARMIMLGLYSTGKVPFKIVYLHGLVRDALGEKMSKSKGNVLDPLDVIEKYGADALRFALIWGVAPGNDSKIGEEKIRGMRNFSNKLWNIGRFINLQNQKLKTKNQKHKLKIKNSNRAMNEEDRQILKKLSRLVKSTTNNLDNFQLSKAAEDIYHFVWHRFADEYIEYAKPYLSTNEKAVKETPLKLEILDYVYATCLKLLHPFMPFVTEAIWGNLFPKAPPLIISPWPDVDDASYLLNARGEA